MEKEDSCFICGEEVCSKELLQTMGLESVKNLEKSFANLFQTGVESLLLSKCESEFDYTLFCRKCINRILDAHNLFNQINHLEMKIKGIGFEVVSLMKKLVNDTPIKSLRNGRKSKFKSLQKEIIKDLNKLRNSKDIAEPISTVAAFDSEDDTEDYGHDSILGLTGSQSSDDDTPTVSKTKTVSTKRKSTPSPKTPKTTKVSTRKSTRLLRAREKPLLNEAIIKNEPILTDSSDVDEVINIDKDFKRKRRRTRTGPEDKNYNPDNDTLKGKIRCPDPKCKTVYFDTEYSLNAHIKRIHEGIKKPFECEICGKSFQYPTFLKAHALIHTGQNKFPCSQCTKVLTSEKSRRLHEKSHSKEGRPFSCGKCGKTFVNRHRLTSHLLSHQTKAGFQCEQCGKAFYRHRSLILHMRLHENPEVAQCPTCLKNFSTVQSMRIHQELHGASSKLRQCKECSFECYERNELRKHAATHPPKESIKCQYCERNFVSEKGLRNHVQTNHALEVEVTPSECRICQKPLKNEDSRNRHEKLHFGQTLVCEFCGKSFALQSYLTQHLKIHGKELQSTTNAGIAEDRNERVLTNAHEEVMAQTNFAEMQNANGEMQLVEIVSSVSVEMDEESD